MAETYELASARGDFIFLSHNARDKAEVEALAHWMIDRGLQPWLDKWELRAGLPWQAGLEQALREARAVLVCIGAHGLGRVQQREIDVALNTAFQDEQRAVIPVLLPNAAADALKDLGAFLRTLTWIDLRGARVETYDQLDLALRGRVSGLPERGTEECPFRGLEPFEEEHARWFFGRERELVECLQKLREQRLLVIVGASGSGKSSLVRAGLVPAVRTGQLDQNYEWTPLVLRPGPLPLRELALRLIHVLVRRSWKVEELRNELLAAPSFLADELDAEAVAASKERRFLLVLDQFEEAFAADVDPTERRSFLDALMHAATVAGGRTTVVWTLRADFLAPALRQEGLAPQLNGALYLLGPMGEAELREAVRHPSRMAGLQLDEGLESLLVGSLLVEGAAAEEGDLPLLQFGLEELWRRRAGRRLTVRAHEAMGGLKGALQERAENVLDGLRAEGAEDTVRRLFGRLVQLGEGMPDTRRRLAVNELKGIHPEIQRPLEVLIRARLITAQESTVEVAHEALIREWPTLRQWIDTNREALRTQAELARAAALWQEKREGSDLWRGGRLNRALELSADHAFLLSSQEEEFLRTSRMVVEREAEAEVARSRRELLAAQDLAQTRARGLRQLRVGLIGLGVLTLALAGASTWAWMAQRRAERTLNDSIAVAESMVFQIGRQLEDLSGAAQLRDRILQQGAELLEKLREGATQGSEERILRNQMVYLNEQGDLNQRLRDLARATENYTEALKIAEVLAERDPSSAQAQRDLSVSYNNLGDVGVQAGDLGAARTRYEASLKIREMLAERDPSSAQAQRDLSVSFNKLGDVGVQAGDLGAARTRYEASLRIREMLAERDPSSAQAQRDLSLSYDNLGDVAVKAGDLGTARTRYEASLKIAEVLVERDPSSAQAQRDLSVSYNKLGDVGVQAGDLGAARTRYEASLKIAEVLAERDPSSAQAQRDLSVSYNKLGAVGVQAGDLGAARTRYEASLKIREVLAERDPSSAQAQRDLSLSYFNVAVVEAAEGRGPEAKRAIAEARSRIERALARNPSDPQARADRDAIDRLEAAIEGEARPRE